MHVYVCVCIYIYVYKFVCVSHSIPSSDVVIATKNHLINQGSFHPSWFQLQDTPSARYGQSMVAYQQGDQRAGAMELHLISG